MADVHSYAKAPTLSRSNPFQVLTQGWESFMLFDHLEAAMHPIAATVAEEARQRGLSVEVRSITAFFGPPPGLTYVVLRVHSPS